MNLADLLLLGRIMNGHFTGYMLERVICLYRQGQQRQAESAHSCSEAVMRSRLKQAEHSLYFIIQF